MVMLALIILYFPQGARFAALNMKDAYFHVAIHPAHCKFIHFWIGHNHYQFQVLPFGRVLAPQVFTKVFAVVAVQMCYFGYSVYPYLDDWLFVVLSRREFISTILSFHSLLTSLGICVNEEKSVVLSTRDPLYWSAAQLHRSLGHSSSRPIHNTDNRYHGPASQVTHHSLLLSVSLDIWQPAPL